MTVRVVLVDDQALVRGGFAMLIAASDDIEVVGEAGNGEEAVRLLQRIEADVVLMDIRMPIMDGVAATGRLTELGNPARVLVLTTFDLDEYVFAALKAGAAGFLLKDARPDDLLSAIRSVAAGDSVVAPSATRRLLAHVLPTLPSEQPEADTRLDVLTDREREVLAEVGIGATNAEICERLYMAEGTVKTHVGRLLAKLACRDRIGLVLLAHETGLVGRP
ncbi:response regulator [Microlunatus sp. Y2014]|uniref:response regulator n=1 Tax=Microlunatus sp. Y2014 TaxID=3418488 RepID=UPI003DA76B95